MIICFRMQRRVPGMNELDNLLVEYVHDLGRNDGEYVVESSGDVWLNLSEVPEETRKARNTQVDSPF